MKGLEYFSGQELTMKFGLGTEAPASIATADRQQVAVQLYYEAAGALNPVWVFNVIMNGKVQTACPGSSVVMALRCRAVSRGLDLGRGG